MPLFHLTPSNTNEPGTLGEHTSVTGPYSSDALIKLLQDFPETGVVSAKDVYQASAMVGCEACGTKPSLRER